MIGPLLALLILTCSAWAQSPDLAAVDAVTADQKRLIISLSDGTNLKFDPTLQFQTVARELLATASGKTPTSILIQEAHLRMSAEQFHRLLALWPEMPLKARWTSRLSLVKTDADGSVLLRIHRALAEKARPERPAKILQDWLGCDSSQELCLGMSETLSNPNHLPALWSAGEITPQEKASFLKATASFDRVRLTKLFEQHGFPTILADWYALRLLSRRQSLNQPENHNSFLQELKRLNVPGLIQNGDLIGAPQGFDVDFTFEHLEARLKTFLWNRASDIEKTAQYVLSNLPFLAFETEQSLGRWSVAPGFMFRVKRRVEKNPNAKNALEQFRVTDSLELFVSVALSANFGQGPFHMSVGGGPAYLRRYTRVKMARSEEEARKGYWGLPKDLLLKASYTDLQPREQWTVQSGWVANTTLAANVKVAGQSHIRPQALAMANYQWLSRSHFYRASDGTMYVGAGSQEGFEVSAQVFWKVISKITRIPVLTTKRAWMTAEATVYKIDDNRLEKKNPDSAVLREAIDSGRFDDVKDLPPRIDARAQFDASDFWFDWGLRSRDSRRWKGLIEATPPSQGMSWLSAGQNFFLLEKTDADDIRWSLTPAPKWKKCSSWAALALKPGTALKTMTVGDLRESSLRMACSIRFDKGRPYEKILAENLSRDLQLPSNRQIHLWDPAARNLPTEIHWSLTISDEDLRVLFADRPTGWAARFLDEMKLLRETPDAATWEQSQERFLFATALMQIFQRKTPAQRLEAFFNWLSSNGGRQMFLATFLKRSQNHELRFERWTATHDRPDLIFQEFKLGSVPRSSTFELLEERDKWFGH